MDGEALKQYRGSWIGNGLDGRSLFFLLLALSKFSYKRIELRFPQLSFIFIFYIVYH